MAKEMMISELIEKLEEIKNEDGDMPVKVFDVIRGEFNDVVRVGCSYSINNDVPFPPGTVKDEDIDKKYKDFSCHIETAY